MSKGSFTNPYTKHDLNRVERGDLYIEEGAYFVTIREGRITDGATHSDMKVGERTFHQLKGKTFSEIHKHAMRIGVEIRRFGPTSIEIRRELGLSQYASEEKVLKAIKKIRGSVTLAGLIGKAFATEFDSDLDT